MNDLAPMGGKRRFFYEHRVGGNLAAPGGAVTVDVFLDGSTVADATMSAAATASLVNLGTGLYKGEYGIQGLTLAGTHGLEVIKVAGVPVKLESFVVSAPLTNQTTVPSTGQLQISLSQGACA